MCGFDARQEYSEDLSAGPKILRPWMLHFRSDFGLAQVMEPEELLTLAQLYLVEGWFVRKVFFLLIQMKAQKAP